MFEQLGINLLGSAGDKLIGGLFGGNSSYQERKADAIRNEEYVRQKEFAQHGVRWKVEDAKEAGLHPLAVLGGSSASYSPASASVGSSGGDTNFTGVSDALASMGQNTKRAQMAAATPYEREMEQLALDRARLQNRLLEGQVQNEWAALMGQPPTPALPMTGAVTSPVRNGSIRAAPVGQMKAVPSESVSAAPTDRGLEAARTPSFKRYDVSPNVSVELPGEKLAESLESMGVAGHVLGPLLSAARSADHFIAGRDKPLDSLLPAGYEWKWNKLKQSWSAQKKSR